MPLETLIKKYNVPGPRYTSYPTVPYWDVHSFSTENWISALQNEVNSQAYDDGLSIYIHLPYCESLCTYCGCNTRITVNHAVEEPYIDAVLKEWAMYKKIIGKKPLLKEIHLGGGTPTFFSPANLEKLMKGILSDAIITNDAEFSFEAHPKNTTVEHLKTLYQYGFRRLSLGIQDFDPVVQDIVNRIQTYEQVKEVTDAARSIGYTSINFDLIYGLPKQTLVSVLDTIQKVNQLKPDRIAFYSYAHVPWIKPGQRKFTELDLPEDEVKRKLYEEGRASLESNGYKEIGMDHFALENDELYTALVNKKMHRNFMGYTPRHTAISIGLGVSSISDSWTAFAQNVKTVEEYKQKIEAGVLPVFRGHILNQDDLKWRKHILDLMCTYETNWSSIQEEDQTILKSRLTELISDQLLVIEKGKLVVNEKGKPFLRNVCMAFDQRLHVQLPESTVFSKTI